MRKPIRLCATVACVAGLLLLVPITTAKAQGWLEDRDRAQGPGIRLGDFELHPGIGIEVGWDSNVYYTEDNPPPMTDVRNVDSGILRVTPHLLFSTLTAERRQEGEQTGGDEVPDVQFSGGLSASYYEFFADESRRNVSVDAGLRLTLFQGQPVSFTVYEQFGRSVRPFTENLREASFARISNDAGLDITFATTGGVLQVGTGYRFGLDFFEESQLSYANTFTHQVSLREAFRFLPQTAIVHETNVQIRDYFDEPPPAGDRPLVLDSVRLTSMLGLNGAITPEISFMVMGGYGAGFFAPLPGYQQDYDAFLARAEVRWRPEANLRFALGYDRAVHPSFIGNYYTQDRGYLNVQMMFGGVFLLGLEGSVGYYDFGQIVAADGMSMIGTSTERNDIRVIGSLFGEYRFTEWLAINGTLRYTGNFTDFQYLRGAGIFGVRPDPAQFNKVELWLGVRVFY